VVDPQDNSGSGGGPASGALKRQVGLGGAVLLGLGSILGTGVFVSIGIAAGVLVDQGGFVEQVWPLVLAVVVAAVVAICNGLSSAQLAAAHPVSGGTYEYGYRFLHPTVGFVSGAMFLTAKSASAATAALGFAGYLLVGLGTDNPATLRAGIAVAAVVGITALVLGGLRRSNWLNAVLVGLTIAALATFVAVALASEPAAATGVAAVTGGGGGSAWWGVLSAAALLFVAYTGYGRVATLGEEVTRPRWTIPRAVILTLAVTATLYIAVAFAAGRAVGLPGYAAATTGEAAPLELIARRIGAAKPVVWFITVGAIAAMLGVLLNLVLGLSRVLLAMGRRRDVFAFFGSVNADGTTPVPAVIGVAVIIGGLAAIGSVKVAWSLSAFTVLVYYAATNAAALKLPPEHRLYPRVFSWLGLIGCLGLAVFVDWPYLVAGLGLVVVAAGYHRIVSRGRGR